MIDHITNWLVASTPLKNICQLGLLLLFPTYGNIKNVPNHEPAKLFNQHDSHDTGQNLSGVPPSTPCWVVRPHLQPSARPGYLLNHLLLAVSFWGVSCKLYLW